MSKSSFISLVSVKFSTSVDTALDSRAWSSLRTPCKTLKKKISFYKGEDWATLTSESYRNTKSDIPKIASKTHIEWVKNKWKITESQYAPNIRIPWVTKW